MSDYRELNRANWDDRVPIHLASDDYGIERFITDPFHLSPVVETDRDVFGDVTGKTLAHLQCHIGTDSISWARLGATVTGLDFSPAAIAAARRLSADCGTRVEFVEADVYDAPSALGGARFDLVYTGVGAIVWLPDVRGWAEVVAAVLKPGGVFYIREGHPVLMCLDETRSDGALALEYSYFEQPEPMVWDASASYVGEGELAHSTTHEWNHGVGETVTALIDAGLEIEYVREHDYTEWQALGEMTRCADGKWRLPDRPERAPLMLSIRAVRR